MSVLKHDRSTGLSLSNPVLLVTYMCINLHQFTSAHNHTPQFAFAHIIVRRYTLTGAPQHMTHQDTSVLCLLLFNRYPNHVMFEFAQESSSPTHVNRTL